MQEGVTKQLAKKIPDERAKIQCSRWNHRRTICPWTKGSNSRTPPKFLLASKSHSVVVSQSPTMKVGITVSLLLCCISLELAKASRCCRNDVAAFAISRCTTRQNGNSYSPQTHEELENKPDFSITRTYTRQSASPFSTTPRHPTSLHGHRRPKFFFLNAGSVEEESGSEKKKVRKRVKEIAKGLVGKPLAYASNVVPMPAAIASILKEASLAAVDHMEDLTANSSGENGEIDALSESKEMMSQIIDEAFAPMEASLDEMEANLVKARKALSEAKAQSTQAIEAIQVAAIAQAEGAAAAVAKAERVAERQVIADIYSGSPDVDVSNLSFEDVDFDSSEMAPPFLDPNSCLVPGEPVVRVEKAPENSRRIFAGVDIMASVDDVWNVLTNYAELQKVVPNLAVNDVLDLYEGTSAELATFESKAPEEVQCKQIAEKMKGALLRQVGGAKVAGINFSAKTTLEVREWPQGMPDFAHFNDEFWEGKSREERAKEYPKVKLTRYRFPRPFALSSLPTRDISMQSIVDDDGEFRMYQGVWRMQPLPGCSPPGQDAMRLSYAVEISPRAYLPVQLVENRIARDLCTNLEAIRNAVSKSPSLNEA